MTTIWIQAALISLLLASPAAGAGAAGDPPDERAAVVEADDVMEVEGEEPLVLHWTDHLGRGYMGVRLLAMTPELREHYGAPSDAGVLVSRVEPGSPAARAGIQVGDIITSVDGDRVESPRELSREVRRHKDGDTLKLEVSRNRSKKELTVKVEERQGHELHLGDIGRRVRDKIRVLDLDRPLLERRKGLGRLEERLEDLEKRLKELEKRVR